MSQGVAVLENSVAPASPDSGYRALYPKADGWHDLDSAGNDRLLVGASLAGSFMTAGLGVNDTYGGILELYGPATGTEGGELRLYNSGDDDGTFEYWVVDANTASLRVFRSDAVGGVGLAVTPTATGYTVYLGGSNDTTQFPVAALVRESAHASSRRATLSLGSGWLLLSDYSGNGTRDFTLYGSTQGQRVMYADTAGAVVMQTYLRVGRLIDSHGYVTLSKGTATQAGYVEWYTPTPTRMAFMGWNTTNLGLSLESGFNFDVDNGTTMLARFYRDGGLFLNPALSTTVTFTAGTLFHIQGFARMRVWGGSVSGSTVTVVSEDGTTGVFDGATIMYCISASGGTVAGGTVTVNRGGTVDVTHSTVTLRFTSSGATGYGLTLSRVAGAVTTKVGIVVLYIG